MLRKLVYSKIEPPLNEAAKLLSQKNITPNQVTLGGLVLSIFAGWALSKGNFFLGGLLTLTASLGDLLDGPLARLTGKGSRFGSFLDSTVDRYSDFFLFGGLSFYFARQESWGWFLISLGILLGALLTSYTKARAESLIPSCSIGTLERPERIILLILGSFFLSLLPWILMGLFIGTNATAIQRILFVKKTLEDTEEKKGIGKPSKKSR